MRPEETHRVEWLWIVEPDSMTGRPRLMCIRPHYVPRTVAPTWRDTFRANVAGIMAGAVAAFVLLTGLR